jgi:4-alpha-glucanotransferase
MFSESYQSAVHDGLRLCGVDKLFLQIHDASFPSQAAEDIGRGSPYTEGAASFLKFVHGCGFNGVQLGPQGATARDNASPYDSTVFSRNPLCLPLAELVAWDLLTEDWVAERLSQVTVNPERVDYTGAWSLIDDAIGAAYAQYANHRRRHRVLTAHLDRFRTNNQSWLERDVLYAILFEKHDRKSWRHWVDDQGQPHADRQLFAGEVDPAARINAIKTNQSSVAECCELVQFLVHSCHLELRRAAAREGLQLYADLQIGMADQDNWAYRSALLAGYLMGAPPSRTNRAGQPWGFAVLDPAKYWMPDGPGSALRLVIERLRKIYSEYDGVRVDHPHGWVCPWVYRSDIADPFEAVQNGARLFSAPDLEDHPNLARYAIAKPDQLDRERQRYAENWLTHLTEDQIDQYGRVFTRIVAPDASSRQRLDLVCEVLSTLPYPLKRVLDRFGLGRFRVLQKVDPNNPTDVYRSELAEPVDWIMLGNHDTPPIWRLVHDWVADGRSKARAEDLSQRLCPEGANREDWVATTAADAGALAHALFADLLISRARNIMVFMSDLLGMDECYNVPGTVNDQNWTLRVPRDYAPRYAQQAVAGQALSLPRTLLIALEAPALGIPRDRTAALRARLEREAVLGRDSPPSDLVG